MSRVSGETPASTLERLGLSEVGLPCPHCGEPSKTIPDDETCILRCTSCNHEGSFGEWYSKLVFEPRVFPDRYPQQTPPGCRVVRSEGGPDTVTWDIPPSLIALDQRRIFVASVYVVLPIVLMALQLICRITGRAAYSQPASDVHLGYLILTAVVIGGLYLLYRDLLGTLAAQRITVNSDALLLTRSRFGWARTVAMARNKVVQISDMDCKDGITIRGVQKLFHFGKSLRADERSWLVADLSRVVSPGGRSGHRKRPVPTPALSTQRVTNASTLASAVDAEPFSVIIPGKLRSKLPDIALNFIIVTFLYWDFVRNLTKPIGAVATQGLLTQIETALVERFQDLISGGYPSFSAAFVLFYSFIFFVCVPIWCVSFVIRLLKDLAVVEKIEGDASRLAIRRYRLGALVNERWLPRSLTRGIRMYRLASGRENNAYNVELLVADKAERLATAISLSQALSVVNRVTANKPLLR